MCIKQISQCLACTLPQCVHDTGKQLHLCPVHKEYSCAVVNYSSCGVSVDGCSLPFLYGDSIVMNSMMVNYRKVMRDI